MSGAGRVMRHTDRHAAAARARELARAAAIERKAREERAAKAAAKRAKTATTKTAKTMRHAKRTKVRKHKREVTEQVVSRRLELEDLTRVMTQRPSQESHGNDHEDPTRKRCPRCDGPMRLDTG